MLWFFLSACEDVKIPDNGTEETISTADSEIEEEDVSFTPALFTMLASFGVEGGSVRSFTANGTEIAPNIRVAFYNTDLSESCMVYALWDSGAVVLEDWNFEDVTNPESPVQIRQKGFHIPEMAALQIIKSDGCSDWDADRYGTLEEKIDHAWGVGFGGALRADVETAVQESTSTSIQFLYENNYIIGGSWASDLWEPSTWASHIFTVSPHENWELSVDEDGNPTEYYTRSEVENGEEGSIYLLKPLLLWDYNRYF